MIIVEPDCELMAITSSPSQLLELAGRTCYKSEDKITDTSAKRFVNMIQHEVKHHSVLEHASATFRFTCDRGVTHEMVRHRLASFSQESTRYCNYGRDKFGGQMSVIEPPFKHPGSARVWETTMEKVEEAYLWLLEAGEKAQIARSILPNCLKTEIVMTCNFREWLHVFELRTSKAAHPQIKEVMDMAKEILAVRCHDVFGHLA